LRISVDKKVAQALEEITDKKLSKNGNAIIAEVIEMAERNTVPDDPCWIESNCSNPDKDEVEK